MGAAEIVQALGGRMTGSHGMVHCPAHDDTTPSLHVTERDGHVLVHCHAGCSQDAVLAALARRGIDLRRACVSGATSIEDYRHLTLGAPSRTWPYHDATGRVVGCVARFETPTGKTFRPLVRDDAGCWRTASRARGLPKPYPLFHLPALLARPDTPVLIVEGEKTAEAAARLFPDMVAITSMHGAQSPRQTDWSAVAKRDVTIWPDADEAGAQFAATVARLVGEAGAASVRIVSPPDSVPEGWDVADAWPEGVDPAALVAGAGGPTDTAEDNGDAFAHTVSRLAALSPHEYDQGRTREAARLHVRVGTLDAAVTDARVVAPAGDRNGRTLNWPDVEPWPTAVAGAALLTEIAALIKSYVYLVPPLADALALWVVMTWLHNQLEISTFLNVTSATKRCGKSLLLDVVGALVSQPMPTSHVTPAAFFRVIERHAPTLLLDEADRTFAKRDIPELIAAINGSQRRDSAFVLRCVGDDHEPRRFGTWCPKVLVGIGDLPDTVRDRALVIRLERRPPNHSLAHWRDRDREQIARLQRQIVRWTVDRAAVILAARNTVGFPPGLHDRACDAWEALLAMGHIASDDWAGPDGRASRACRHVTADTGDDLGAREQLLADLHAVFQTAGVPVALPTARLLKALHALDGRPWSEWRHGKPLSPRGLATLLTPFHVRPVNIRLPGGTVRKGYRRDDLTAVWQTYLHQPRGVLSATPLHPRRTNALDGSPSATPPEGVADTNGWKVLNKQDCSGVADRTACPREAWEERAAIVEFDAYFPREQAEALATELITRDRP